MDNSVTKENLQSELINFANSWDKLKNSAIDEYTIQNVNETTSSDEDDDGVDEEEDFVTAKCKSCKNCAVCCYKVLIKYNLYSEAYKTLTLAYKYLLTLPTTQVACERSFSTLKFIKNRLRNTLSDVNLEAFMLMAVERKVLNGLDSDLIIDKLAENSSLLRRELSRDVLSAEAEVSSDHSI